MSRHAEDIPCAFNWSWSQDERLRKGYHQSVLEDEDEEDNEAYNYRVKMMKNVVRSAITLSLEVVPPCVSCRSLTVAVLSLQYVELLSVSLHCGRP